jgi:small subunit ribosomal protein S17
MAEAKQTEKVVRSVTGRVVSDKMDKTVTVLVERSVKHPLYGKVMRRSNKFHAHDETNECREGDLVVIEEGRPLSRTKTWRVSRIVEKARAV